MLKECIGVLLQVLDPLAPLLEGGQFPASYRAGFLERCELRPQFVQGNEALGLLVLVGASLTFHL